MEPKGINISYLHTWNWDSPSHGALCEFVSKSIVNPDFWNDGGETIWKTRHKEVKVYKVDEALGGFRIAIKNYHEKRFWRYFLRPSLALREAIGFNIAKGLGIPVAEVIAFGEMRRNLRLYQAYFVTRFEEDTKSLLDFAHGHYFEDQHAELLSLLHQNMFFLARLHNAGYRHGGAHPRNFLWRNNADNSAELIWIDLATIKKINFWNRIKSVCLDITDMLEVFRLTQEELDSLAETYNKNSHTHVRIEKKDVSERKFCICRLMR